MTDEIIRPIAGAPGYVVSSEGKIYREIRSQGTRKGSPPTVTLRVKQQSIYRRVHSLVMEVFGPGKPFPAAIIRHWDGNPKNSHPSNLVWGTHKDNAEDARRHGTLAIGERQGAAKLTAAQVQELRVLRSQGWLYRDLGERFGISRQAASDAARGFNWKHVA